MSAKWQMLSLKYKGAEILVDCRDDGTSDSECITFLCMIEEKCWRLIPIGLERLNRIDDKYNR